MVIICHGFRCSNDRIPVPSQAFAFEKEGITAFRFDLAGNGDAEDIRAVVELFRRKQLSVTAVIGHSKGGNAILLYASRYKDIPTIVNIAGRFDLRRRMEARFGEDFKERHEQDGFIDVKTGIGGNDGPCANGHLCCVPNDPPSCRELTVHGEMDQYVPVEDAMKFADIIPNHTLHIVEGADHDFTKHQPELATILLNFVKISLNKRNLDSHL